MKELLLQRLKTTFGWNRILCRLIAAWSLFAAGVVLQNRGFVPTASPAVMTETIRLIWVVEKAMPSSREGICCWMPQPAV